MAANSYVGAPYQSPSLLDTVGLVVFCSTSYICKGTAITHLSSLLVGASGENKSRAFAILIELGFISYLQRFRVGFVSIEAALRQSGSGGSRALGALAQATSLRSSACKIASSLKGRWRTLETSFRESDKWLNADSLEFIVERSDRES